MMRWKLVGNTQRIKNIAWLVTVLSTRTISRALIVRVITLVFNMIIIVHIIILTVDATIINAPRRNDYVHPLIVNCH